MTALELWAELSQRGAVLWADGDRLRYRAPEGAIDAALRTQLGEHKEALLRLLRHDASRFATSYPLSYGQRALWFLNRLDADSPAYNTVLAARIHSDVDLPALRQALAELAQRHTMLRSTYSDGDVGPMQHVHHQAEVALLSVDGRAWSEAQLHAWLASEARRPFDLEQGPVWRVALVDRPGRQYVLLMVVHHIAVDVLSYIVLIEELRALYPAARGDKTAELVAPQRKYADYVLWQAQWLRSAEAERLWTYWRERLSGELPVLALPTDRMRPPVQTFRGAAYPFPFDDKLILATRELAASERATLSMALLTAFAAVLQRYTGQSEIVIGSPTTGRTEAQFANVVGFFANAVVLRLELGEDTGFRSLLGQVRQTVIDAQAHQAYPFPLLVQRLQPQRDASRSPLFQVSFTLDRAHWVERLGGSERTAGQEHVNVGGLQLVPMPVAEQEGQFDLALQIIERGDACSAYLKYNTDLYDESTVERLAGHYVRLLGAAAARPHAPLWSLPLLSEAERAQCEQWNATGHEIVGGQTIHGLVQAQAQRTPERIAVVYEGQSLSYAQLDERADRLAGWLRSVGVGAEALVGVCVERSLDMVVAVLGVLKAGGAYVPLDPTHPRERLELVLEDSGAKVLLTQQALKDRLRATGGRVVCIDTQWHEIAQARLSDPVPVRGQDLAYVMYTSGSTGRPKGVQVEHAAVVNLLGSMSREPGLSADDVLLAVTNLSFDIAGLELFLPLSVGARVVVAASEACVDGSRLARLLAESGASAMQATPVTWQLLLAAGWAGAARLKVLCGGEALPRELAAELLAKAGQVWNLYGPTETTIWSTVHRVSARAGAVPIGRPIANTSVRVLDAHQQLVPVGVWGELYIGGRGVARGYFKRPELTAERFVADPVAPDSGERLYRTGDLVRYLADGSLEFQGRMDDQVKVRGFRIELGEIEAALARHPAVRDQAVVVRADASAEGRLVAYVVLEAESALAELGNFLRMKLPGYMVPAVFVPLAKLPVTPNGKVDRRALPAPAPVRPHLGTGFAAPRDALEQLLAHTYAAVLGVDRVGIHDNFFELGGHSLLAMQVHSRLRQNAGIDLPLHTLFEAPTTADLADAIRSARPVAPGGPDLVPVPRTGKIPLSFAQERLWVLEQLGPGTATYNFPQAFRLIGPLNVEALRESFREVLRRHEGLRSHIHVESGKPALRIADALQPRLEVTNLRTLPAKQREAQAWRRIRSEACRPFDLERGPLLRTTAIQLDEDEHWVLLTAHHIVVDGWSMGVLVREITALYEAYAEERASPLQPLPIQYPDYSFWQRQWFDGEVRRGQLGYWRQQLAGELPVLQLPADRPRPAVRSYRGASRSFALPLALVDALRALARSERATLFMVLLTGFAALLSRHSGQTDITVGAPSANRNRREVEDLIGLFLNMLVLRADLSGDPSFGQLLARIRQVLLDAYAHQDMPFERLVEDLQPQRDRSRTPLFQVVFALQNVPNPVLQLSGLEVRPLELHTGTSKFDLSVSVTEGTDGAVATWEYNTDLYDESTVERLAGHYVRLLGAAAARPQAPLWSLPLLSEAERAQCEQWNATGHEIVGGQTIHGLVQAQAQRTPERIAVVYEGQSLSYAQLDERADRLAGWLRSVGVGAEALVGVCVERSLDMVVAVLGVLKAGGAYVPLDPTHPRERLELVLEDSGAKVLLTQQALKDRLRATGGRVVCIDTQWHEIAQARLSDPVPVRGQDLAYVMYTSGSTGRPKGVQVEHAAVVNLLGSMSREPGLSADDVLLAVTNLSFDIAGLELFLPLSVGARVVVAASEACVDGTRLARLLAESGASAMQATPVTWRLLLAAGWAGAARLKVLCGGEALPRELAAELLAKAGQVWNLYGPTETTIWSTVHRVSARAGAVPIGRPIANTSVRVLDAHQQLVPVGVWGELYIGGRGVARGYFKRPELTAERFVADPVAPDSGERLYRTGDLVRYLADGSLEFQGRMDDQVKVRGFRIELGEIEAALARHPAVRDQAVVVRADASAEGRLVAYVVLEAESALAELGNFLRMKLPGYMVPAVFVPLAKLPVTPNGKVDRRALPAPAPVRPHLGTGFAAPRDALEQLLAHTYAAVLGVDRVGIHDNFFELGGASLSSLEIAAQLHEAGVPIPPEWIFEHQTIAQLAAAAVSASTLDKQSSKEKKENRRVGT